LLDPGGTGPGLPLCSGRHHQSVVARWVTPASADPASSVARNRAPPGDITGQYANL